MTEKYNTKELADAYAKGLVDGQVKGRKEGIDALEEAIICKNCDSHGYIQENDVKERAKRLRKQG